MARTIPGKPREGLKQCLGIRERGYLLPGRASGCLAYHAGFREGIDGAIWENRPYRALGGKGDGHRQPGMPAIRGASKKRGGWRARAIIDAIYDLYRGSRGCQSLKTSSRCGALELRRERLPRLPAIAGGCNGYSTRSSAKIKIKRTIPGKGKGERSVDRGNMDGRNECRIIHPGEGSSIHAHAQRLRHGNLIAALREIPDITIQKFARKIPLGNDDHLRVRRLIRWRKLQWRPRFAAIQRAIPV
jgi:hypothetical protein